ncbi:glycine cleavage system aminomethyltransferase GcvT [Sphingobium subterraneum]|uniref:aminomethyltransferase n=1 Tax=Sphingobium subterraneum TaxID=627688 RepID=A0A841J5S3_9SPHN|nr:aminomethyltransferase [Sphingobium subterraneum]
MTEYSEDELEPIEIGTLPLDAWHRARGARMVEFAGYHMPIQYDGIMAEHSWTRDQAGLFDVSHMGQISLTGDGLDAALEAIIPAEVSSLAVGRQRYSLLLDEEGGILDDLMVSRRGPDDGDDIFMVVNGATKYDDLAWLLDQLPDDITLNLNEDQALLALQGPRAAEALAQIVPGVDALFFMQCAGFAWRGNALWISRSGYTGEDGFEISIPADAATDFADALCAIDSVKPIGLGARDSLRLEAGLPLYGHDLDPAIGPIGAGLGFAINKKRRAEGGFIGHARVAREVAQGAPLRQVGLSIEGRLPAREGAPVFVGAQRVGVLTSGGFAPTVGAPIAMARVEAAYAAPGTALEIEVRGKRLAASVTPMPFVPHRYHRQGGSK